MKKSAIMQALEDGRKLGMVLRGMGTLEGQRRQGRKGKNELRTSNSERPTSKGKKR